MKALDESESSLLELKAKVGSLDVFREKLRSMKAHYVGAFRQIDTYFVVPKGRLKLREMEGKEKVELIYYEREDISGPKRSRVFILEFQEPEFLKKFFESVLETKVVINKRREIYRYEGTQIHLDTVEKLGTFIEFERKTEDSPDSLSKNRKILDNLMKALGIRTEDLIEGSYSDLAASL